MHTSFVCLRWEPFPLGPYRFQNGKGPLFCSSTLKSSVQTPQWGPWDPENRASSVEGAGVGGPLGGMGNHTGLSPTEGSPCAKMARSFLENRGQVWGWSRARPGRSRRQRLSRGGRQELREAHWLHVGGRPSVRPPRWAGVRPGCA